MQFIASIDSRTLVDDSQVDYIRMKDRDAVIVITNGSVQVFKNAEDADDTHCSPKAEYQG